MEKSDKWIQSKASQKFAGYLATLLSVSLIIMLGHWGVNTDVDNKFLGGMEGKDTMHLCTWHAVLMPSAMCVALINAILSYRQLPFGHKINKIIHGILHTLALVCAIFGVRAIVKFHNDNLLSNLSSLHSWLGLTTLMLFAQNYILGFLHFAIQVFPISFRVIYKPFHRFLGIMTMFVAVITMETGIIQKNGSFGCSHSIKQIDNNPASGYGDIPAGCRLSSGIGLILMLIAILVAYAVWQSRSWENGEGVVVMPSGGQQIQVKPKYQESPINHNAV